MAIEIPQRITFLKRCHLFKNLTDDQLTDIAQRMEEETFAAGTTIITEGASGDRFYLIYQGSVKVTQKRRALPLGTLVGGDYFGEGALMTAHKRTASVQAEEETLTLSLLRSEFTQILKHDRKVLDNFRVTLSSYQLARRLHFSWIRKGEVIYFLATKHPFMLAQSLFVPVLLLLLPLFLLIVSLLYPALNFLLWLTGAVFLGIVLWIAWKTIDWGNDYYIVTNQRVVYLEKVIGLYDSTQEAPLSTILSVGVETDLLGRQMGFGNVIIRTFVGRIIFQHVSYPNQAAAVVEEHWTRSRESSRRAESDAMRNEIRLRLGMIPPDPKPQTGPAPVVKTRPSFWETLGSSFMKIRIEKGGIITYRKHRFVLFRQIWAPTLLILVMVILPIVELFHSAKPVRTLFSNLTIDTLLALWLIILIGIVLWWIYQYVDWSNDIFQVTPDQILDIDRTPFGSEERKAAPLENILSTEAKREGLLEYLLNYGTVYISVGGAQMSFQDVANPAMVQQDIDNRRMARVSAKADAQAKNERERLADWFAAYHIVTEEMRDQAKKPNPDKPG